MQGLIDGLPIMEYVRDPAPKPSLSASVGHTLLTKSPRHAWMRHARLNAQWEPDPSDASDLGTICHALLLENDESRVVVVDHNDWRTNAAKEKRDAARAEGKLPLLVAKWAEVQMMVLAARAALADSELAGIAVEASIERTFVWEEDGAWCRCRPDLQSKDGRILLDYKSTAGSAEPDAWSRGLLLSMGYDIQAAFGLRAANALLGPDDRKFVFMVQEVAPPYACSFVGLDPQFVIFADAQFNAALALWKACLAENKWPGYSPRIAWASPPEWAVYRFGEREAAFAHDNGQGETSEL